MNKCPVCKKSIEYQGDSEFVCQDGCGSAFVLEYVGMYEEGSDERIDRGFESKEFKNKWYKKINEFELSYR